MTDRLSEIRARLEAATPGPWKVFNCWGPEEYTGRFAAVRIGTDAPRSGIHAAEGADLYGTKPDLELVARAPEDIRYLLELVDRAQQALKPFAEWGNPPDTYVDERKLTLWGSPREGTYSFVTVGDLRRAREVYEGLRGKP